MGNLDGGGGEGGGGGGREMTKSQKGKKSVPGGKMK